MGLNHSPSIVTSNLVFAIDAANIKSINLPTQADHGWADWYCITSGTATYSIVVAGVSIFQRTAAGVVTTVVGPSTGPTRGTITVTAGNTYYGDGPINLVVENLHQCLVPTTMAGTLFWTNAARGAVQPYTIFVYSPNGPAQLRYYDATTQGIYSTPSAVINVAQGSITTFQTANNGGVNSHMWLTSNVPVVATANASFDVDKTILTPMSQYVYRRYPAYTANQANTTGTLVSNYYTLYDSNTANKVMDMNVADGSGGDSAQGLGLEYLSENYSWGNYLSDYVIAAPYSPTNVSVQHWNGSVWTTLENHTISGGTILSAAGLARDGTANVGNAATTLSGTASYFNNSLLWKWTGDKPFYLCINDTADDEFAVLGWSNASTSLKPRSGNTVIDLSNNSRTARFLNAPLISDSTFEFNGVNSRLVVPSTTINYSGGTFEIWFKMKSIATDQGFISHIQAFPFINFWMPGTSGIAPSLAGKMRWEVFSASGVGGSLFSSFALSTNTWYHLVGTFDTSNVLRIYINGFLDSQLTGTTVPTTTTAPIIVGDYGNNNYPSNSYIAIAKIYNRALSAAEVEKNFDAHRGRFGI